MQSARARVYPYCDKKDVLAVTYDIDYIKELLLNNGYACVLTNGKELEVSRERGVKPLVNLIDSGKDYGGYIAADKVVGKAAALLYAKMCVKTLYAHTLSAAAQNVCKEFGVAVTYNCLTENIINRAGTDLCPMEKAVANVTNPQTAYNIIKEKLKAL